MQTIREWAQSVIIAALVAAIVGAVTPSGSFEKPMKVIVALFMLVAFVSPLVSIDLTLSENSSGLDEIIDAHNLENQVEEQVRKKLEDEICAAVAAYAAELGIDNAKVSARVEIDSEKNIATDIIEISLSSEISSDSQAKLTEYVRNNFGIEPIINVGAGE